MRQYEFRGRDRKGYWRYGDLVHEREQTSIRENKKGWFMQSSVDAETVGMFTGMVDQDGKRIYEGDIIQLITPADAGFVPYTVVVYSEKLAEYGLETPDHKPYGTLCAQRKYYFGEQDTLISFRVAGNIWDNPEYLSQKKEENK